MSAARCFLSKLQMVKKKRKRVAPKPGKSSRQKYQEESHACSSDHGSSHSLCYFSVGMTYASNLLGASVATLLQPGPFISLLKQTVCTLLQAYWCGGIWQGVLVWGGHSGRAPRPDPVRSSSQDDTTRADGSSSRAAGGVFE
jgi:hypothetical protein